MSAEALYPVAHKSRIRSKILAPVELVLTDGSQLTGNVFIGTDQRVLDMLNSAPAFIAFRTAELDTLLIAKTSIAVCRPIEAVPAISVAAALPGDDD